MSNLIRLLRALGRSRPDLPYEEGVEVEFVVWPEVGLVAFHRVNW